MPETQNTVNQLLTADGPAFQAALAGASHEDLARARWEIDGCGPEQFERQRALIAADDEAAQHILPAGPTIPTWAAADFTASEDLPRLGLQIARGKTLTSSLAAALGPGTEVAVVPLAAFDRARALFQGDVNLGMWRWKPAWGFDLVPDPWPLAYLLEATRG
jgi:hypothetical protein